jgi:hypothetical protein
VSPHRCSNPTTAQRLWAMPLYRIIYDPDGRPWPARLRGRLLHRWTETPHDGTRGSARISSASPSCEKPRPMLRLDDHCLGRGSPRRSGHSCKS